MQIRQVSTIFLSVLAINTFSQENTGQIPPEHIPIKYLEVVYKKADGVTQKLDKKSEKALEKFRKQEAKLIKKLSKIDSLAANNILITSAERLKHLENKLRSSSIFTQYIPSLDTLSTSLKFLNQNPEWLSDAKEIKEKFTDATKKINDLQASLQKAENIKEFLRERRQYLKEQLLKFGFVKYFKRINKDVYYYSRQISEYREILKDQDKIEKKVIELLVKTKFFRDFMKENSMLASLFPMPASTGLSPGAQVGFASLQTRVQLSSFIQQSGMGGSNMINQAQQSLQNAVGQVSQLSNQVSKITGSARDLDMPDFKPNSQKTKSFFQRLEYGTNFQSQRANTYFPSTSDIGLSLGFKLNDKSIIGVGTSYKIGWGSGLNNIRITHQGVGLRSYIDWKIKGELWISGGYEKNYRAEFNRIDQLRNLNAWQSSGLIGVSKTFSIKTKVFNKTKLQLLWDFLSYSQTPRTQSVIFRIGYNF